MQKHFKRETKVLSTKVQNYVWGMCVCVCVIIGVVVVVVRSVL